MRRERRFRHVMEGIPRGEAESPKAMPWQGCGCAHCADVRPVCDGIPSARVGSIAAKRETHARALTKPDFATQARFSPRKTPVTLLKLSVRPKTLGGTLVSHHFLGRLHGCEQPKTIPILGISCQSNCPQCSGIYFCKRIPYLPFSAPALTPRAKPYRRINTRQSENRKGPEARPKRASRRTLKSQSKEATTRPY